jgi:hypothetical protein
MNPRLKLLALSLMGTLTAGCSNLRSQELCSNPEADPTDCYGPKPGVPDGGSPMSMQDGSRPAETNGLPAGGASGGVGGGLSGGGAGDPNGMVADAAGPQSPPVDAAPINDAPLEVPGSPSENRAFVTSGTFSTNLGGLAGADAKCQQAAESVGFPGRFVALLSTSTSSGFDRLGNARGWIRVDGRPLGDTKADLVAGKIYYPLSVDEHGSQVPDLDYAFTGTKPGGMPEIGKTGSDWGVPAPGCQVAVAVAAAGDSTWYGNSTSDCEHPQRLFCFEIDRNTPLSPPIRLTGARIAFISKDVWDPSRGLADADRRCGEDAAAAKLAGRFLALLATKSATAISRLDLTQPTWVRPDGAAIVAKASDLAAGQVLTPVVLGADGQQPPSLSDVWTGAMTPNLPADMSCEDWSSSSMTIAATTGAARVGGTNWFANGGRYCGFSVFTRIYCFQQ